MEFDPIELQKSQAQLDSFDADMAQDARIFEQINAQAAADEQRRNEQRGIDNQVTDNLQSGELNPVDKPEEEQPVEEPQQQDANVAVDVLRAFPNAAVNVAEDIANFGQADDPRFTMDGIEPQMKTGLGKTVSSIVQVVGPALVLAALTRRGRLALRASQFGGRIPKGGIIDRLGTGAAFTGSEALWTVATRQSLEPNLSESLKEWFPDQTGWIPNWIATRPSDSPDTKRIKAVTENVALGGLAPLIGGLRRAIKGDPTIIERIKPTDAKGQALKNSLERDEVKGFSEDPITEEVIKDEVLNSRDGAEMAETRLARDPEGTQPDPYINSPMYDGPERPTKAVNASAVVESLADDYQIQKNIGTANGRSVPILTSAAVDSLTEGDIVRRVMVDKVQAAVKRVVDAGIEVQMPGKAKNASNKELVKAQDEIAAAILDIPATQLRKFWQDTGLVETVSVGGAKTERLTDVATGGVFRAINKILRKELGSADKMRASAKLQNELAGEISDAAEAINLGDGMLDFTTLQDNLASKLALLTYEYSFSSGTFGYGLNAMKAARAGMEKVSPKDLQDALSRFKLRAKEDVQEVTKLFNDLAVIRSKDPALADAIVNTFELTGGDVRDVNELRKILTEAVSGRGFVRRMIANVGFKAPNLFIEGITGLFYNFKLSSLYTPVKAITANSAALLMKPLNMMAGHLLAGDAAQAQRTWIAYFGGFQDTVKMSSWYASGRFRKVMTTPTEQLLRKDYAEAFESRQAWIQNAEAYADATGDLVMQMKVNAVKTIDGFNNLPWVRYSVNMMEAGDGFVGAFLAQVDARMKMLDDIYTSKGKITADDIQGVNDAMSRKAKKVVAGAFNSDGEMVDGVLKYARGEIAMNLDTPVTDIVGRFTSQFPILKTFVMFPRTSYNALAFTSKHTPLSQELRKAMTLTDPKEIADYLGTKGIPYSPSNWARFKAESMGRVAVGTGIMTYAWGMWAQGNMTGNGIYDRGTDRMTSQIAGRPKRSWRLAPGTPWISYDGVEPISSLLAVVVDAADNWDTLGDSAFNDLMQKAAFIIAENATNKSFMDGLQPLLDIANGNEYAVGRYVANVISVPVLNQLGTMINPGVRQIESDMLSQLRSKWSILDAAGIGEPLPYKYDIVEGGKINAEDFIFKGVLPFKMSPSGGPEKDLLIESEFDVQPSFTSSLGGAKLTPGQISQLQYIIGEKGLFKKRLAKIAKLSWVKKEMEFIRRMRREGINKDQLDLSKSKLHREIRAALTQSVNEAKFLLAKTDASIFTAENLQYQTERAQQLGDYDKVERLLQMPK